MGEERVFQSSIVERILNDYEERHGDRRLGIQQLNEVIRKDPENADAYMLRGYLQYKEANLYKEEDLLKTEDDLKRAKALNPLVCLRAHDPGSLLRSIYSAPGWKFRTKG